MAVSRTPPINVVRALRREVGFVCPVEGCGSPYLTWHHFDPPWHVSEHHEPGGMIALCPQHHRHADGGALSTDQLHAMKAAGRPEHVLSERFPWMRERFLTVVGGNFYLDTPIPVRFRENDVVGLSRDDHGYLQLNVGMLSTRREPRMVIRENTWFSFGTPTDLACPPNGRLVRADYGNGDMLAVEFVPDLDSGALAMRYPEMSFGGCLAPNERIAAVEVTMRVGGTDLEFGPRETQLPGGNLIRNCLMVQCQIGLQLG